MVAAVCSAQTNEPFTFDCGPIASRHVNADGHLRLRVLGPFFEKTETPEGDDFWGLRPLYAQAEDSQAERKVHDFVWPLGSAKRFRNQASWRFLVAYSQRFDVTDPESRYRFWLLPVYFQGRDADGEGYVGVFPIGGKIHEILGRDRVTFALFPLWMHSTVNEAETTDVLWPIYSRTEGEGLDRVRVFPFYGKSSLEGKYEKRFVMWPFWTWARYKYAGSSGTGYIVFPLWGHIDLTDQESWMFLPPLFRFHEGQSLDYMYAPWPIVQKSSGQIEKFYLWPLWGKKRMHGVTSSFALWPLFWREKIDRGDSIKRRFVAMPFVYSAVRRARDNEEKVLARYHKIWPLFSYRREADVSRFRVLALWPLEHTAPIERSWAPLWTLAHRTRVGERAETELLWGLYRHCSEGESYCYDSLFPLYSWRRDESGDIKTREWSLLKGLIGYKREGGQRSFRLLYFLRFGTKEKEQ
jgi:hypothetical protein